MQKSVLASFAFLLLLLQGAQQAPGPGETCETNPDNCGGGTVCDSTDSKCKLFPGKTCTGSEQWCVNHAFCDEDTSTCKVKVGGTCQVGHNPHCLEHATCNAGTLSCECDDEYLPNDDNTECAESGVGLAGTVVSLTLMAVSLLVSRLL